MADVSYHQVKDGPEKHDRGEGQEEPSKKCSEWAKEHKKHIKFCCLGTFFFMMILSLIRLGTLLGVTVTSFKDKPTSRNNSLLDSNLVNLGNTMYQIALTFQHVVLSYGIWKSVKNEDDSDSIDFCDSLKSILCKCNKANCSSCEVLVIILLVLPYVATLVAAPIILSVWFSDFILWFDDTLNAERVTARIYAGMAWTQHLCNIALRIAMGIVACVVVDVWSSRKKQLEVKEGNTINDIKALGKNYKDAGKKVAAVNVIFQGWFIMQWIILFIGVTGKGTLLLKALINEEYKNETERFVYIATHTAFDILSFLVPYVFGSIVNSHHEVYYQQLKQRQEKIMDNEVLMFADIIPKNQNFDFLPSLCGFSIPLNSAGYILSIVLALMAFIATFLVAFADVSNI